MRVLYLLTAALPLAAQSTNENLNAVLWVQTSVEYRAAASQTFAAARTALDRALKSRNESAALEQSGNFKKLPPAIICDLDETLIDNSPAQARAILQGNGRFTSALWAKWTAEAKAAPIPGAREFVAYARSRGVTVFYVTNRGMGDEAGTLRNLEQAGFPTARAGALGDTLLLYQERPEWTSDKTTRRAAVAQSYRILLLVGDDFNDFVQARVSPEERNKLAAQHAARWGSKWIILPNPQYGSWEDALLNYNRGLPLNELEALKKSKLRVD